MDMAISLLVGAMLGYAITSLCAFQTEQSIRRESRRQLDAVNRLATALENEFPGIQFVRDDRDTIIGVSVVAPIQGTEAKVTGSPPSAQVDPVNDR